jgi:hypothetical protein
LSFAGTVSDGAVLLILAESIAGAKCSKKTNFSSIAN